MKKYFFNDGKSQQGPLNFDELLTKNITIDTPIWCEGMEEWTTAGEIEEFKSFFNKATETVVTSASSEVVPGVKNVSNPENKISEKVSSEAELSTKSSDTIVIETKQGENVLISDKKPDEPFPLTNEQVDKSVTNTEPIASKKTPETISKKSTAWISWVLGFLILGSVGYFIYQDIEKNKDNNISQTGQVSIATETDIASQENINEPAETKEPTNTQIETSTVSNEGITGDTEPETTKPETVVTNSNQNNQSLTTSTSEIEKKKLSEKAKSVSDAKKKAEEAKKKQEAALTTQSLKEREMRNNWVKYITFGNIVYNPKDEGLEEFNVPVYNGTNAVLEKVTIRVDYLRREGKTIKSETIVVSNIPPGSGVNGKAPANKKARKVNTYFTGIYSKKLHFCFPQNNGNAIDPYFCN